MHRVITDFIGSDPLSKGCNPIYEFDTPSSILTFNHKKELVIVKDINVASLNLFKAEDNGYNFSFTKNSDRNIPLDVKLLFEQFIIKLSQYSKEKVYLDLISAVNSTKEFFYTEFKKQYQIEINPPYIYIIFHNLPSNTLMDFWLKDESKQHDRSFVRIKSLPQDTVLMFPDPEFVGVLTVSESRDRFGMMAMINVCQTIKLINY